MPRRPPPPPPKGTMPPNAGKGRPKGSKNKISFDVRKMAQKYGPDGLLALAIQAGLAKPLKRLPDVKPSTSDSVQQSAIDKLLDRAFGKATQPLEHSVNESVENLLDRLGR